MADIFASIETTMSVFPGGHFHVAGQEDILNGGVIVSDEFTYSLESGSPFKAVESEVGVGDSFTYILEHDPTLETRSGVRSAFHPTMVRYREITSDVGVESEFVKTDIGVTETQVGVSVEASAVVTRPFSSRVGVGSVFRANITRNLAINTLVGVGSGWLPRYTEHPCSRPVIGSRSDVVLTFPFVSPTSTIHLRPPKFGNIESLDTGALNQVNISNQVTQIRPTTWNNIKIISISFEALSQELLDSLIQFFKDSRAKTIGYLDHENRQWSGFIIDSEISMSSDFSPCTNRVAFKIRGSL